MDVAAAAAAVDPDGVYVKRWCPELYDIPPPWCHAPARMSAEELADFGVVLGVDYPAPVAGVTVELPPSADGGGGGGWRTAPTGTPVTGTPVSAATAVTTVEMD